MKVMKRDATLEEKTSSERIKYLIDTYCDGSQNEFARRVGIGKSSVSQYVNGTNFPGNKRAKQIADAFYVEPMWVMGFPSEMRTGVIKKAFDSIVVESALKIDVKFSEQVILDHIVEASGLEYLSSDFIKKYNELSPEGRKKLEEYLSDILKIYHK